MSVSYIPVELRRAVKERARGECEYCLRSSSYFPLTFHVDHVIAEKHGGLTQLGNLAWTCPSCNLYKGTDLSTYLNDRQEIVELYNPRKDVWQRHFKLRSSGLLIARTTVSEGTIKLLRLNEARRVSERELLLEVGHVFHISR